MVLLETFLLLSLMSFSGALAFLRMLATCALHRSLFAGLHDASSRGSGRRTSSWNGTWTERQNLTRAHYALEMPGGAPLLISSLMSPTVLLGLFVGVALSLTASSGHAQNRPTPPAPPAPTAEADSFQQAQQLLQRGNHERAIALLSGLVDDYPNRLTYQYELIDAYEETKAYDQAIALLEQRAGDTPSVSDLADLGRLQYLAGREDAARDTWNAALEQYPDRASTYRSVYHTLSTLRRFDQAVSVMERGRDALGDPEAFRTELAHMYSLAGQHADAMREYVALLSTDERRLRFVRNRLQPFIDQSGDIGDALAVLEEAVADHPDNEAYLDLLAWLYAEQEDYDQALSTYTRLDKLQNTAGDRLLDFADQAANANAFAVAENAWQTIQTTFPETDAARLAQKRAGDLAYRRWTQAPPFTDKATRFASEAWEIYHAAVEDTTPREASEDYGEMWMRIAELALDTKQDLDAARRAHAALSEIESYRQERALLSGRIALRAQDLSTAREAFASLSTGEPTTAVERTAQHRLALLDAYDGNMENAKSRIEVLLGDLSAAVANDAIALHAALRHFAGPDSTHAALQYYASGMLYELQHRWSAADAAYEALITEIPRHPLTERARYHRAALAVHLEGVGASAQALQTFATQFHRHPWADRALFEAASLLEHAANEPTEARRLYMRLIEQHPRSVFASDARARIRQLPAS